MRRDANVEAWQVRDGGFARLRGIDSKSHYVIVDDDAVYLCSKDSIPVEVPIGNWITRDCNSGVMSVYSPEDFKTTFTRS